MTMLRASRGEAMLAANMYNDSSQPRSFEGFVVHMHLAWLYLLQARFTRDNVDYRFRRRNNPRLFERIEGEIKCWDLAKSVKEHWTNNSDPTRLNIEFFIGLRNKIEHRHMRSQESLVIAVSGKAHAFLRNFDDEVIGLFGPTHSLVSSVRFPLFLGSFSHQGTENLLRLQSSLPKDLQTYISKFESGLEPEVQNHPKFEMRLKIFLERGNKNTADLSMNFVSWDELTDEEQKRISTMGRDGRTIIRERTRDVVNHGLFKPKTICDMVENSISFRFGQYEHKTAYKRHGLRPDKGCEHPERTDERYCRYDEVNKDYLYTRAWADRLIEKCQSETGFRDFVGTDPKPKSQRKMRK
jgi:hypothetical protein